MSKAVTFMTRYVDRIAEARLTCEICGIDKAITKIDPTVEELLERLQKILADAGCEHKLNNRHQTKQG